MQCPEHIPEVSSQASLLESLRDRIHGALGIADWNHILAAASEGPVHVQHVTGTVVSLRGPAWDSHPTLRGDLTLLVKSKGGYIDPCPGDGALVLLRAPDDAFALVMELRDLAPAVQSHAGMATGQCQVATIHTSGRTVRAVVGDIVDEAIAASDLAPAGTFRMSPSTFDKLQHHASWLQSCILQTEYEGDEITAIAVTPPPVKGGEQLSTFAGLGVI
jgi:hypothetical protein